MTSLVFSVGIAVVFLTVWGVIMVGAYLLGDGTADASTAAAAGVTDSPAADGTRLR